MVLSRIAPRRMFALLASTLAALPAIAAGPATKPVDANRLAYLDEPCDPYYVGRHFPKLITPQWVGEPGVDAVVVLAIDDMRDSGKYEKWLRPLLDRLKQIDGRAPVSIMTNRADPADPQLAAWLKEGLSIDVHTYDHPCPILKGGDISTAKQTYDKCVDLLASIPGNKPVAFRTPCCDSKNTLSPRLITEVLGKTTETGKFLTIDSSVFNIITANDPELPRELVQNPDGSERFRRYVPFANFVNTIEDYPYPYVINNQIWEFPCVVPSDWEAQNVQKPFNPRTVEDWKAVLDAIVIKKGVFTAVFHPHNWIKPEQMVEFVDYADKKYGKRVKFLNFRECQERLDRNLLGGQPIRSRETGEDNGVRVLDVNNDGYLDVVIGNERNHRTRIYLPETVGWATVAFPLLIAQGGSDAGCRFGVFGPASEACAFAAGVFDGRNANSAFCFNGENWREVDQFFDGINPEDAFTMGFASGKGSRGNRLIDVDGDGVAELLSLRSLQPSLYFRSRQEKWQKSERAIPQRASWLGFRMMDVDEDGRLDLVVSDSLGWGVYLFDPSKQGWPKAIYSGDRHAPGEVKNVLPQIRLDDGSNNGFFIHSRAFWWVNENTDKLPDLAEKRTFNELLGDQQPAAKSPAASLKALKPRPGFQVQLVAQEPHVQDPIAFAFGADARLWVAEMGDYPMGLDAKGKPGGKVRILEDADGDGVYDKSSVFLDGLPFPTGVTPWRKGVLITAAPDILYAEDTDGDGKADKREVLFTGFGEGNQQHRMNGLVMGLDNWFYGANGHSNGIIKSLRGTALPGGEKNIARKGDATTDIRNRDFRIRPDTGEIETATGVSQFGRNRDDWDNWFGNDNSHPLFQFLLEDHYLRRNPYVQAPAGRQEVPDVPGPSAVFPISRTLTRFNDFTMANHFTSANSSMVYRDDLFGPNYAGSVFISEPVHNLVSRQVLRADGLRFRSKRADDEQQSEFLASTDNWFRPAMIRTGPDGALWVADMYRHVIEHPQWIPKEWQEKLDLRAGHDMGRIYRVWPVGTAPRAMVRLDKMNARELVAAMRSPSGWVRDMAQQLLVERQDREAVAELELAAVTSTVSLQRVHALCSLDGLKALTPRVLTAALKDAHPGVRRHATRLAEGFLNTNEDLGKLVAQLATDPDLHVRQQVAYSLGEWNSPLAGKALAKLLALSGDDSVIQTAAMSSLKPGNLAPTLKSIGDNPNLPVPPALVTSLTRMALAGKDVQAVAELTTSLAGHGADDQPAWRFRAVAGLLDAVEASSWQGASPWLAQTKVGGQDDAERARMAAGSVLSQIGQRAGEVAMNAAAAESDRVAALALVGRGGSPDTRDPGKVERLISELLGVATPESRNERLAKLLEPGTPATVQVAAVQAIARSRHPTVPALLMDRWKRYTPQLRGTVLDALLSRPTWTGDLLTFVEKGQIKPLDIDPTRRQAMTQDKNASIRERAKKLLAAAVNPDRQKVIDAMKAGMNAARADAKRGQEVFTKTCVTCHAVAGAGNAVGPDLMSVGDKSPDGLLVAILDPNRVVEPRFISYVIETKAGDTLTGLLASESGNAITLLGPDGKSQQILRSDIRELRSTGMSLMPEGLESGLQPQDLADLIAFVQGVRPTGNRRVFEGNQPAVVVPQEKGVLKLVPATAEISGKTIVLEKKHGNLGYWESQEDEATWTTQPARAGTYDVWIDYSCEKPNHGNQLLILVGSGEKPETKLTWRVEATTNWDTYRKVRVGVVKLEAGRQRITVRSAGAIKGALIDLREVELVPVK